MRRELIAVALLSIAVGGFAVDQDTVADPIVWESIETNSDPLDFVDDEPLPIYETVATRVECKNGVCRVVPFRSDYTPTVFVNDTPAATTNRVTVRSSSRPALFSRLRSLRGNRGTRRCRCN